MALTEKDKKLLINKPNRHFARTGDGMGVRMIVCSATQAILDVYESERDNIQGELIIVRNRKDETLAASAQNSACNALLVFTYQPDSYFTSTCYEVTLSDALRKRALTDYLPREPMMSPTEFMPPLLWLLPQEKYRFYFSQTSKNASGSQKTNSRQSGMEIAVSAADMVAYVGKAIPEHLRHLTHVQNAQGAFIWSAKHGWENEWFVELVGQWVALIDADMEVNNQSIESLAQNNVSLPYCLDCVFDDTPFTPKFDIGFDDATQRVKLTMKLNWPLDARTPIDSATLLLPAEPHTLFDVRRSDGKTIRGRLEDGLLPSALRA